MSPRTLKRICLVGFMDFAYRLFLRDFVRRQVGMETTTTKVLRPPPASVAMTLPTGR